MPENLAKFKKLTRSLPFSISRSTSLHQTLLGALRDFQVGGKKMELPRPREIPVEWAGVLPRKELKLFFHFLSFYGSISYLTSSDIFLFRL
jgi:hypothetical protein